MSLRIRWVQPDEAVSIIKPRNRVFIHSVAGAPQILIQAMTQRASELRDVEVVHLHTEGEAPYTDPKYASSFHTKALFVGANVRKAVEEGQADYIPVFLSEVPSLFRKNILPLDVAMVQVSPPDRHGFCSLGVSVDVSRAAVEMATYVIAQVNPKMPRTHGDGLIHMSQIHSAVLHEEPLAMRHTVEITEQERMIGKHVAALVEDNATLQMGIGAIPDAVLAQLGGHRNLGVHTEMFSDGIIPLVESGVINGKMK
ncbi:MAG: 4-hydroxybutyrate CoA-transferase, partial [Nitrospinota bacterium]|nr:4-hydroxybutyrate CoA-transferase [Nitrospinota bacterium]